MTTQPTGDAIPGPTGVPLMGNVLDVDVERPVQSMMKLARQYGPIFALHRPDGRRMVVVSGFPLVDEISDDARYDKVPRFGTPERLHKIGGHGLFPSETDDPMWHKAHNILLPSFSGQAIHSYYPVMLDLTTQLVLKWQRLNPGDEVDVPADMTRMTLDTIALAGFNYRFNSFYRDGQHPFVASMFRALKELQLSNNRLPIQEELAFHESEQYDKDVAEMQGLVDQIVAARRAAGPASGDQHDILQAMLTGVDRQTGESLDDTNIRDQAVGFLIAGHETTSSLLSFALYFVLKHPTVLHNAQAETDRVLGTDYSVQPTLAQVNRLTYISQILKESLRLWPTAPGFTRHARQPTLLGGAYHIQPDDDILILSPMLHRDQSVWGENAELFDPENFSAEAEAARPANAWKPFGTGARACIGRQFALQEATLVLGMLLWHFDPLDHRNYELEIREGLTIKPENFWIQVQPRRRPAATSPSAPATTA